MNFNYIQEFKTKKKLKEWELRLEYKINFIFDWKVRLKRKINLVKGIKKQSKEWGSKLI
jgi:hypothetical protein